MTQRRLERVGDLPQPAHGWIDDPSLHSADVRPIKSALSAEALLRVACALTEFAHNGPDGFHFQIGRVDLPWTPLHRQIRWCYVEAY
jgi:hypothetical protein